MRIESFGKYNIQAGTRIRVYEEKGQIILQPVTRETIGKVRGLFKGSGALKILREDPLTTHIPVLAISANAMPHDIRKGLDAGFLRYLTKPIKVNEFMDALNVALEFSGNKI